MKAQLPVNVLRYGKDQPPPEQVPLAYAESALAVQMLIERGGPLSLATLLQDLAAGREFAESIERRFFLPYTDFQAAWASRAR